MTTFGFKVLDELPGAGQLVRYYPPGTSSGQDGIIVAVTPASAPAWMGMFARGMQGTTRVIAMPDDESLCVISRGAGYLVRAAEPDAWSEVDVTPILDAYVINAASLVIFASFTELVAFGVSGERWRTERLALDGFTITRVTADSIVGEYWDLQTEAMQTFEVDLASGCRIATR